MGHAFWMTDYVVQGETFSVTPHGSESKVRLVGKN